MKYKESLRSAKNFVFVEMCQDLGLELVLFTEIFS